MGDEVSSDIIHTHTHSPMLTSGKGEDQVLTSQSVHEFDIMKVTHHRSILHEMC